MTDRALSMPGQTRYVRPGFMKRIALAAATALLLPFMDAPVMERPQIRGSFSVGRPRSHGTAQRKRRKLERQTGVRLRP